MWVWLKLKTDPGPKGDFCVVSVTPFFVRFFIHSPIKEILEWVNIVTFHPKHPK